VDDFITYLKAHCKPPSKDEDEYEGPPLERCEQHSREGLTGMFTDPCHKNHRAVLLHAVGRR
jgi:hypothetical protein